MLAISCQKNSGDPPAPSGGSLTGLQANPDSALPGTLIDLNGSGLQGLVKVGFDTVDAAFNPVYNTATDLLIYVPANARYGMQEITLTNGLGGTARVGFKVVQPAPLITSIAPLSSSVGDTVTITGSYFRNILSVLLGAVPVQIIDSSSSSAIQFIVPSGVAAGLITINTAGGSYTYTATFTAERAILIADFDGGGLRPDGASWYSYGDMSSKIVTNTNPAPISGNFLQAMPLATNASGYAGVSTYTASSGSQIFGLTSAEATTYLKFDANSNGYTNTQLQVNIGDVNGNNFDYMVNVSWSGWQTVSISLADFYVGYGTTPQTPSTLLVPANITTVKFHFLNYLNNPEQINLDNIRFSY